MDIKIRLGVEQDIDLVARLYDEVIDHIASTTSCPWWRKGVYPTRSDAVEGIGEGTLFVATDEDEIVGSMILLPRPEPAYLPVKWQIELDYSKVLVVHTLAVSPSKLKGGIGRSMLEFADKHAKAIGVKSLRLDVYQENLPAIVLYERCGYRYIDTVSLGLESYGLNWFRLYEKLLS